MQNTKQYITETEDGYELCIELEGEQCADVDVESITMFISKVNEAEDGDEDCYFDGDLAVNYNIDALQNDETAQTMGMLLVRNIHSEDDVTKVMGEFYWEGAFTQRLNAILAERGFTANTAHTSEWGMQDEGRASYDACELADEIRSIMQTTTA
jgi:O-methyltransferase involved in polyketide biosynthesis